MQLPQLHTNLIVLLIELEETRPKLLFLAKLLLERAIEALEIPDLLGKGRLLVFLDVLAHGLVSV